MQPSRQGLENAAAVFWPARRQAASSLDTGQVRWDSGRIHIGEGGWEQLMDEMPDTRQLLAHRIEQKQQAVRSYLGRERPRRNRLSNISVLGSALAATLTAGPAFGGTGFTNALQGVFSLSSDSIVWRVLCLAAVLLSISSALATNFANSHSIADKVSAAETANVQLDGLRDALSFGQISTEDALKLYQQYIARVAFVDAVPSR